MQHSPPSENDTETQSMNSPHCMEPEGSVPHVQKRATGIHGCLTVNFF